MATTDARNRAAQKTDWSSVKEMPAKNRTVQLNVGFTEQQMDKIKKGFIPEEMEDKWFIYYVEDEETLYLHRSWTGFCIYVVKFKKIDRGFAAMNTVVNEDSEQYKCGDDETEKDRCLGCIGALLLGEYGMNVGSPLEAWSLLGRQSITPNTN